MADNPQRTVPWEAFVALMADYIESEGTSRDAAERVAEDWLESWAMRTEGASDK